MFNHKRAYTLSPESVQIMADRVKTTPALHLPNREGREKSRVKRQRTRYLDDDVMIAQVIEKYDERPISSSHAIPSGPVPIGKGMTSLLGSQCEAILFLIHTFLPLGDIMMTCRISKAF